MCKKCLHSLRLFRNFFCEFSSLTISLVLVYYSLLAALYWRFFFRYYGNNISDSLSLTSVNNLAVLFFKKLVIVFLKN